MPAVNQAFVDAVHRTLVESGVDREYGAASLAAATVRYEIVRKLTPRQFAELYERNLRGEGPFDALVEALAS